MLQLQKEAYKKYYIYILMDTRGMIEIFLDCTGEAIDLIKDMERYFIFSYRDLLKRIIKTSMKGTFNLR